jgi:hypothetical protein
VKRDDKESGKRRKVLIRITNRQTFHAAYLSYQKEKKENGTNSSK